MWINERSWQVRCASRTVFQMLAAPRLTGRYIIFVPEVFSIIEMPPIWCLEDFAISYFCMLFFLFNAAGLYFVHLLEVTFIFNEFLKIFF